jgi:hypothetical protein
MQSSTRVLAHGEPVRLGVADAPLSFARPEPGRPGLRQLRLDGEGAYSLTFWCGTCPLVFERLGGANRKVLEEFEGRLNGGLSSLDEDVIAIASRVIPDATYMPLLLELSPQLVSPSQSSDYFAHEQVEHRGIDQFWGLPNNPRTPYYRGASVKTGEHDRLFEFIVPMVPPSWNDEARVAEYEGLARTGLTPTVLALSILDRTQPFDSLEAHWGLMHFVLDGHHKLQAAARSGTSVTMLALVSIDDSLSSREETESVAGMISRGEPI